MLTLPTIEELRDTHRALKRFTGYRWATATVASATLTGLAYLVLGGPPSGFSEWPPEARAAASSLVRGVWRFAQIGGLLTLLAPAVWLRDVWLKWFVQVIVASLVFGLFFDGLQAMSRGLALGSQLPTPGFRAVLRAVAWATLLPMAIGTLPLLREAVDERLAMVPALRRLLRTGVAPSGGWMTGAKLKAFTRPLPRVAADSARRS